MPTTKVQISLWATPDELAKLEDIKQAVERNTQADTLRMLINWGHKFFCSQNVAIEN